MATPRLRAKRSRSRWHSRIALCLPRPDGALGQGLAVVGDHQIPVDAHAAAEPPAGLAGAHGRVEGEQVGNGLLVVDVAFRAVQVRREAPGRLGFTVLVQRVDGDTAPAVVQGLLQRLDQAVAAVVLKPQPVLDHLQPVAPAFQHPGIALALQQVADFVFREVVRDGDLEGDHGPAPAGARHQPGEDAVRRVPLHLPAAAPAVEPCRPGEQQLQVVVELRHGADRGARRAYRIGLVDGNGRRNALDPFRRRLVHAVQELPGVR